MSVLGHSERDARMIATAMQVADFAYKQGVGDAAAVDDLVREYPMARQQLEEAVALLEEVRKRSRRPFGGHAPYDLAVRIERFLDDGVYEPHPDAGGQ
jgi:hypothetical protein